MTAVLTRSGRHRALPVQRDSVLHSRLVPVGLGLVAFALRALGLRTANDVFIDEVTYASFADQIAHGQLPNTGGELTPLWLLAALGASAMGAGARLRNRARQAQPAEEVVEERIEELIEISD